MVESTLRPASEVITSPAAKPAWAVGPPLTTLLTVGPEGLDPPELPVPLPKRLSGPLCALDADSSTPRKAVDPTCTVVDPWPDSICRATARAWSTGMANPSVPEPWEEWLCEAAVSMPITWPAVLTKEPPESPGWMLTFTWTRPESCSLAPSRLSRAVMG